MNAAEEQSLIAKAQAGNQEAVTVLYQTHVQKVYAYVARRVGDPMIAEDITADVFVRALETLAQYEQKGLPFLGWLYRIAAGKVIDYYRWSGRRAGNQNLHEDLPSHQASPEESAFRQIQEDQVLHLLHHLTAEQQQVVTLRFLQGHSIKDVAQVMGKNEGAIKGLQFRALQALAQMMQHDTD